MRLALQPPRSACWPCARATAGTASHEAQATTARTGFRVFVGAGCSRRKVRLKTDLRCFETGCRLPWSMNSRTYILTTKRRLGSDCRTVIGEYHAPDRPERWIRRRPRVSPAEMHVRPPLRDHARR